MLKSALLSICPGMEALQSGEVLSQMHKNTIRCDNKHRHQLKENVTAVAQVLRR